MTEKVDLIAKPPTEEIVTREELLELLKTNSKPKHYIGLEISGFLHLMKNDYDGAFSIFQNLFDHDHRNTFTINLWLVYTQNWEG